jgi:hypothetical protein
LANNSTAISNIQFKTYADANDQFLAWSPASGNDVIIPVQNLFSTVPLVVGTTITVGNSLGVVINTTAIAINGSVLAGGGGYAGGNLVPSVDDAATLGNTSSRFETLNLSRTITIGNSGGQTTINTTAFSGQANSALFIGSLAAANVVSNAQLATDLAQYQPTVTLGAAVAALAANTASFIGSLPAASVANNSTPAILTSIEVGNIANNVFINTTSVAIGNSTSNTVINATSFASSYGANGYTFMPGGLILSWGVADCNTTSQAYTWPKAFSTNAFNVQLTSPNSSITIDLNSFTNTGFHANSSSLTGANIFFMAIGV